MRIGILTACRTNNNGTNLQALAMQMLFSKYSEQVEIINYKCNKLENSRKVFFPRTLRGLLNIPFRLYRRISHNRFRKDFFRYSKEEYDQDNLNQNRYDIIVVGSDQVWNLKVTGEDLSFFLPYKNNKQKKYSYAVSLGKNNIIEWENKYSISKYLLDFEMVSVRESSATNELLSIGVESQFNLDPLLMINRSEWKQFVNKKNIRKKYICVYLVEPNNAALKYAIKYADENDCEVYYFGNQLRNVFGVKIKRFVSISEWLGYIESATAVVTNSYHGLAFCILFEIPFSCWELRDIGSSMRMKDLIDKLNIPISHDVITPDWRQVEYLLTIERQKSLKYVNRIIGK